MGRELQKRKNRSSRPKVRVPNSRKKALNPLGNNVIAKNWDKKQTLTQNYRRLGIAARLQAPTGGVELTVSEASKQPTRAAETHISEARVERDSTGRIVRVLSGSSAPRAASAHKPLNDPLAALDSDDDDNDDEDMVDGTAKQPAPAETKWEDWGGISEDENDNEVVRALVRQSRLPVAKHTRFQSEQESEWLAKLVAKHGDNVRAMAWDRKLNPFQQTVGDISKRLKRWRKAQAESAEA
ncbi:hypothetical protein TD95_000216 [Thielaviopsis punctulata]|uniref:Nucleolar protein 16 n=1 Tax=Thielaviopsis punctulata TaxID=72032 RepID=A0A0F4ZER6_9PEZI|nr:hypothetical protein TD95_000216 [Thielaviopsis punctulata]